MLDVHEQQLLVLLFVIEAEFDEFECGLVEVAALEEIHHRGVDMLAVAGHIADTRPRDETAIRSWMPFSHKPRSSC